MNCSGLELQRSLSRGDCLEVVSPKSVAMGHWAEVSGQSRWPEVRCNDLPIWNVVPGVEGESAAVALSGPRVQLGLGVRRGSSTLGVRELNAGRDAVDGLNHTVFLSPL